MARRVYTRDGDDGTTGLYLGGRVSKDSVLPRAYGEVDEAAAVIGVARAHASDAALDDTLVSILRDLWVLMAELATDPSKRDRLEPGSTSVDAAMIGRLEQRIDQLELGFTAPIGFAVPGGNVTSASLDVARTVVRRAERASIDAAPSPSLVVPYLNRLSDLLWMLARSHDAAAGTTLRARDVPTP